eukprot:2972625-Amphidinium_carterae.1
MTGHMPEATIKLPNSWTPDNFCKEQVTICFGKAASQRSNYQATGEKPEATEIIVVCVRGLSPHLLTRRLKQ